MNTPIPNLPAVAMPLTEESLCTWLGAAVSGEAVIYHRGMLALDLSEQEKRLPENERVRLARVASRAWRLAEAGLLHLVQRRRGSEDIEYVAVARPKPRRGANALALLHASKAA